MFSLLLVYVASALALLVTTSFLGLRRYLRQRRIEMPAPMAATWVGIGAVLIVIVMLLAALIPRPNAEYAISQVPWQATSPGGMSSSRFGAGRDGSQESDPSGRRSRRTRRRATPCKKERRASRRSRTRGNQPANRAAKQESDGKSSGEKSVGRVAIRRRKGWQTREATSHREQSGEPKSGDAGQPSDGSDHEATGKRSRASRTANAPLPEHAAEEEAVRAAQDFAAIDRVHWLAC